MSNNPKQRVLITIVSILVLANIALLLYFLWFKPNQRNTRPEKNRDMMAYSLENEVGFNQSQMTKYQQLKEEHKTIMKTLFEDMHAIKIHFYKYLQQSAEDSVIKNAASAIGEKQKSIDLQIFHHFNELRTRCTPEQQPRFDSLIQRVVNKMSMPFRKRSDRKPDSTRTG